MSEKVRVKATRAFALGGKFHSGRTSVPAGDVARLVRLGLIHPPASRAEPPPVETADESPDLEALTVPALREMAKGRVEGFSTMKKAELIEALSG